QNIKERAEGIYRKVLNEYRESKLSGQELYLMAEELVKTDNYIVSDKMSGHRLGDYPHAKFYKGSLRDFKERPRPHIWMFEIHLIDESGNFGAFYEDILY